MKLIWLMLLFLVGCGHATVPKPYEPTNNPSALQSIQPVRAFFQDRSLRVEWSSPTQADLSPANQPRFFRLHFNYPQADCRACAPTQGGWLKITATGKLETGSIPTMGSTLA